MITACTVLRNFSNKLKKNSNVTWYNNLKTFFFSQECPSGVVNEETFKHIYAQFFPHGGKSATISVTTFCEAFLRTEGITHLFFVLQMQACTHIIFSMRLTPQTMAPLSLR